MGRNKISSLSLALMMITPALSWGDMGTVTLYQVGKNGNYCVSTNRDTSGCISGTGSNGSTINVMDLIKGKKVVFENLSDAPHDMKFTGKNADDLPTQDAGAGPVSKDIQVVDLTNQKITCSFHGDQLAVGYRVLGAPTGGAVMQGEGHKSGGAGAGAGDGAEPMENPGASKAMVRTGLADVSSDVLAKGRASDVARLVSARPELMKQLEEVRPLLAKEVASQLALDKANAGQANNGEGNASGNLVATGFKNGGGDSLLKDANGGALGGPSSPTNYKIITDDNLGQAGASLVAGSDPKRFAKAGKTVGLGNQNANRSLASSELNSPALNTSARTKLKVVTREKNDTAAMGFPVRASGNAWTPWILALIALAALLARVAQRRFISFSGGKVAFISAEKREKRK